MRPVNVTPLMRLGSAWYAGHGSCGAAVTPTLLLDAFHSVCDRMTAAVKLPSNHRRRCTVKWLVSWLDRIYDELDRRGITVAYTPGDVYPTNTVLDGSFPA